MAKTNFVFVEWITDSSQTYPNIFSLALNLVARFFFPRFSVGLFNSNFLQISPSDIGSQERGRLCVSCHELSLSHSVYHIYRWHSLNICWISNLFLHCVLPLSLTCQIYSPCLWHFRSRICWLLDMCSLQGLQKLLLTLVTTPLVSPMPSGVWATFVHLDIWSDLFRAFIVAGVCI